MMPLAPATLASSLENDWLVPSGGSYPDANVESGDRFARAVADWLSGGTAAGFPCTTAVARQQQLAGSASAAFAAQSASAAGALLAVGLMGYVAGQVFGPGAASPPAGVSAAQSSFTALFSDLNSSNALRAQQMALVIHTLVLTTIVIFPPVISPPVPIV